MYFSLYKTSSHFLAPVYAMLGHKIVPKKKKNCKKKNNYYFLNLQNSNMI